MTRARWNEVRIYVTTVGIIVLIFVGYCTWHLMGKDMTSILFAPLSIAICIILLISSITIVNTHHQHHKSTCTHKPPYTTLYVYTQPVQSICVILEHNGKVVQAQDSTDYNTDYNQISGYELFWLVA